MDRLLFGIALGIISALVWPLLPANSYGLASGFVGILIFSRYRFCGAVLFGVCWSIFFFNQQLFWLKDQNIPLPAMQELTITVENVVAHADQQQIQASVQVINHHTYWPAPHIRLKLPDKSRAVKRGDQLHVWARLKIPHGLGNPAGFNSERWLLGQGVTATGNAKQYQVMYQADHSWRDQWLMKSRQLMQGFRQPELLMALIYGEQQDVDKTDWQTLRDTGLIHLIAISGMHIGLIAWIGVALSRLLFRRFTDKVPALHGLVGMALAVLYSALADFSAPTVRSLCMLVIWMGLRIWQREWSASRIWMASLACLLFLDPWSLFSAGFWLSFIAVAILGIAGFLWRKPSLWQVQCLMTLLLIPLQLMFFDGLSLSSILINLPAGPWFTFSIVPVALVSGLLVPILPPLACFGFWLCDLQLDWLMSALTWIQARCSGWITLSLQQQQLIMWLLMSFIFWYFFRINKQREWGLLLLGGSGFLLNACQSEPEWRVDMLDVGQGLSVLVTQNDRALLFDTGDAFPGGYNMADAAIFPMLEYRGSQQLDYLFVSHRDKDHAANWQRIHQQYPQARIISSSPLTTDTLICQRGQYWSWGRLQLTLLSPLQSSGGEVNEDSCVLRISDGEHSVLLTGDVERDAEAELTHLPNQLLRSQILSSPHHGSKSSSSAGFIAAVAPQYVVHSAGYQNKWHHPNSVVLARYAHTKQWITATDGMISFEFDQKGINIQPFRHFQPWYRQMDAWLVGDQPLK